MVRQKQFPANSAERSIYFYRINIGERADGTPAAFDAAAVLARLRHLPFSGTAPTENYWDDGTEAITCSWVDDPRPHPRMRLAIVRRQGLPLMESSGALSPLDIPVTAGLAEQIHLVFFPNNIVGSEFNFYGPRVTRLGSYLRAKQLVSDFSIQPLLRHDALRAFDDLQTLRLLRIRIHRNYLPAIQNADASLGELLGAMLELGNAEEAEISLRSPRARDGSLGGNLLRSVRRILQRDPTVARPDSGVSAFEVRGASQRTHRVETIDLLSDRLVVRKRLLKEDGRHRVLITASAYKGIEEAYAEVADELPQLASIEFT